MTRPLAIYAPLFLLLLACFGTEVQAQNRLGYTTTDLTLRSGPSRDSTEIGTLAAGEAVFIFEGEPINDYLHVIRIETDEEGWVHQGYVTIDSELPVSDTPMFSPTGRIESVSPEVEIWNNTNRTMTLTLNDQRYQFGPQERRSMTLEPGVYRCRASSPGVIPYVGSEPFEANMSYTWQFYIETTTVPGGSRGRRGGRRGR